MASTFARSILKKRRVKRGKREKLAAAGLLAKNDLGMSAFAVERYPLNEPYAYAEIIRNPSSGNIVYTVVEPKLTEEERLHLENIKELLIEVLDMSLKELGSSEKAREHLRDKFNDIVKTYRLPIDDPTKEKLLYFVIRDFMDYGKIDPMMHDPLIEDISCDGVKVPIFIWHRNYESIPTNVVFDNENELDSFALRLAYLCGRHISIARPMLDATLPEGSRINITYGKEVTRRGSTFSIRKFRADPLTITDLLAFNTLSPEMAAYFWYAIENRASVLVSGGIASGKTTLLNCLSMFIKPDMKIVSIEDTPEINLPHENWIPSMTRIGFGLGTEAADITLFDLLKASVRQRPDFIIVGEIRGEEAYTLFQALTTGHLGMSTIHAESVDAVVYRLESEPMNIPRTLIAGLDMITVQKRVEIRGKPARRTVVTTEVIGLDPRSREILTNQVYTWNAEGDAYDYTGRSYLLERIVGKKDVSLREANEELKRRKTVLDWMLRKNIRAHRDVSNVIRRYYENPESVYERAMRGV